MSEARRAQIGLAGDVAYHAVAEHVDHRQTMRGQSVLAEAH
ncbi:MAG: hypothetical protein ACLP9L_30905 [Thermoguttaceae bacterium]